MSALAVGGDMLYTMLGRNARRKYPIFIVKSAAKHTKHQKNILEEN